ncbi:MAG: rhomboid family intramembrane serine protease [Halobacteria archaeon]
MANCEECGDEVSMPYECNLCGKNFCGEHRLPENHRCSGLEAYKQKLQQQGITYNSPDLGSKSKSGLSGKINNVVPITGFKGNVAYLFLALMVITFLAQKILGATVSTRTYASIFLISSEHITYVWTWVISIFAHAGLGHLFLNGIVLYFFGPLLERTIGSKKFFWLFMITGIVAGIAQVSPGIIFPAQRAAAWGASGAIMGILGTLTLLNPNLRVYLWFVIPMPLFILTGGYVLITVFMMQTGLAPGIGHVAHLSGLVIGAVYGDLLRRKGFTVGNQFQLSGGGGPGGPGGGPPRF